MVLSTSHKSYLILITIQFYREGNWGTEESIFFFKIIVGCPERLDHITGVQLSQRPHLEFLYFFY